MTTGEVLKDRALTLAVAETDREQAVTELMTSCEGRRVPVVRARQQLAAGLEGAADQPDSIRAIELLDELLERLPAT